uniref:Uncharacterized protein n=1 Tax=Panagrolaimus sp. JU765 TaxID=591449 RepID=A0AC34QKE4_9BILA
MAESQPPSRTVLTASMQTLFASVLQALWIGFDSFYFVFYCHEIFNDVLLTIAITSFEAAVFLGTVFTLIIKEKINLWLSLFGFSAMKVFFQISLVLSYVKEASIVILAMLGFCIGVIFANLIVLSTKKMASQYGNLLVSIIYACSAGGIFISSILLEKVDIEVPIHPRTKIPLPMFPNNATTLSNMHVHSRYPPVIVLIISAVFQGSSLYPFYSLWKTKIEQPTEDEYQDINNDNSKLYRKILFLCCVMGFFVNALFTTYPYFLFAYNHGESVHIYFTIFCVAFLFGRIVFTAVCRHNEHNIILSLSFVLCGISICFYSFQDARIISSGVYGFGLSMINPVLTIYIGQITQLNVHVLLCACNFGPLLFPLPLTLLLNNFGPQLFTSVNFLILLITVFFFVWLLNVQSKMDKPEGENAAKIWRFFRGEGAFKRTKSLRKFIGSIRGSIRGRRYRRMQGTGSPINGPANLSPQVETRRLSPNRLSPYSHGVPTYRSIQNRQKNKIEIEDESSSTATISTPTN